MKNYLSLIPISTKVHKRKNRMTQICIFLAVFLVTGIFSMAGMELRGQKIGAIKTYGNWHIAVDGLTQEEAEMIALRTDVAETSWYNSMNYRLSEAYVIDGKRVCICGMDEPLLTKMMALGLTEGEYPENEGEALLLDNAKASLAVETGDTVVLHTPSGGEIPYKITGFGGSEAMVSKLDAVVLCLPVEQFMELYLREGQGSGSAQPEAAENSAALQSTSDGAQDVDMLYYVQFKENVNLRKAIDDIKQQYHLPEESVGENTMLLGLAGASEDTTMTAIWGAAMVLFLLVLLAGTLMIASSMNSNIAQRTSFFGMLHCIGADRKQTMRFVRLEALYWCRTAIPAGVCVGVVVTWLLCALLRFLSGQFFADMPVFGVSVGGIFMGIVTGLLTVLIAARSPAKAAARVSPLTAVSGNVWRGQPVKRAAGSRLLKIETSLGVYHAWQNKRNFLLMTGSFAISIILFLSFSSLYDFMGHALTPLRPYTPDFSIVSMDETCSVPREFVEKLYQVEGVKKVYGRQFAYDVAVEGVSDGRRIMLISYEALQFNWADEERWASDKIGLEKVAKDTDEGLVLAAYSETLPWQAGETLETSLGSLTVAGFLEHCPFNGAAGTEVLVCSEALFAKLTGETDYTIIDIQTKRNISEEAVEQLRSLAGDAFLFSDNRLTNQSAKGAYYSLAVFVGGFLAIISVIAAFNIINSISMSVSARLKQYGAMRAIGMEMRQVTGMIFAETCTYAAAGILAGILFGLPLHRLLWDSLIYTHWNDSWEMPVKELLVIIMLVAVSCAAAVRGPAKRIREMDVVEVIADY